MATNPFEIFHIHAEKVQKWRSAPVYQYYVRRFDKPEFSKGPFGDEAAATREVCGQIRDMLQAEIDHLEAKLHDLEEWGGWCPNCACIHCQQKHEDRMSISNKLNEIYNQLEQLTQSTPLEDIEPQDEGVVAHIRLMLDQLTGQKHPTVDWDSFHRPGVPHVYMLWAHPEGEDLDSQVELRAICSNRERAEEYKKAVEHESEYRSNTYRMVYIEQRRLNHFYCPGMIYALRDIPIPDDVSEEVKAELRETLGRDKE